MKEYKKIGVYLLAICLIFALTACNDSEADELEADTDYQFKVDATCESGTIEISLTYENAEEKMYIVNSSAPCNDKINIPANTTETACFSITIVPETKGDVAVEVLTR